MRRVVRDQLPSSLRGGRSGRIQCQRRGCDLHEHAAVDQVFQRTRIPLERVIPLRMREQDAKPVVDQVLNQLREAGG